ncbi:MAG: peptidoglycan DD-metalloendopeptidase family protein [Pseudomonadota bacterium]
MHPVQAASKKEHAAKQEQLKDLRGRIAELQRELSDAEESKSETADALRESERAISAANRRLFELALAQSTVRATLADLQQKTRSREGDLSIQQQRLERLLYRQYTQGAPDSLRLLLSGASIEQSSRDLVYYRHIAQARAQTLTELHDQIAGLRELADATREKQTQLAAIEAEQKQEKQQLEKQQATKKQVLHKLSRQIGEQRRQITTLQRDEKRLTRLVERLAKLLTQRPARKKTKPSTAKPGATRPDMRTAEPDDLHSAFRQLKGKLNFPLRGELAGRFGSPRADGGLSWKGLFIRAQSGAEIRAVAAGRVVYADWLRGFGNLMVIDHGDDYMSLYGNNEALYKQVGDNVTAGDAIASVGNSGGNEESGLYFELRFQGRPLDPMKWLR